MNPTTALRTATLLAVAAGLGACSNMKSAEVNPRTVAIVKLTSAAGGTPQPNPQSPVQGVINFSELRGITSVTGTVTELGLFTTIEKGIFADVKRPKDGGKGLAGVVVKDDKYFNPFIEVMKGKVGA